ncbi:GNAT family N-acetyltransferase [Labrenzia sp. R4_2]|uniref:GNAT family N-acetyltransferase n=1 Tax=Labrenzia sp. R4_2 TaxID=2821107 RepID=UPI001ADB9187|nr:GNAT family N-acetyltransferase [Labrenzia sp. R4_2]MBO9418678.1 GNAT family N-acetyltransferase [Labrenzia sp. R4_2]
MSAAAIDISGTHPGSGSGKDDLQLTEDLKELASEWTQLESAGIGNPYHGFLWCKAFQETMGTAERSRPLIALLRSAGRPVLLLPLSLFTHNGIKVLAFLGARFGNQNTGLWDKAFYEAVGPETLRSVLDRVCQESSADCIDLQNVPCHWNGRPHPLVLDNAQLSPNPLYRGSVTDTFEDVFKALHSKSARKNLTRKQRHLQEAGNYEIRVCQQPAEIEAGLEAFLEQREARAQITGIPNAFSGPEAKAFLHKATQSTALPVTPNITSAPLKIWTLSVSGQIRATYLCARDDDTLHAYSNSVAHDEFLKNSPGLVLIREIVEKICADPETTTLDLGIGEEHYKTSWTRPEPMCDSRYARTAKGKIYSVVQMAKTRLKSRIRNSDRLWTMVKKLRQMRASGN